MIIKQANKTPKINPITKMINDTKALQKAIKDGRPLASSSVTISKLNLHNELK